MNKTLILIRIKSFLYSAGTLAVSALIGVFLSEDFASLVQQNVGDGIVGVITMLILTEATKHVRNKIVVGKAIKTFGSLSKAHDNVELI